jgi:hypothetical protein
MLASRTHVGVESELPFLPRTETAQAGKLRGLSLSETKNNLVDQTVQLVGGFGLGQVLLPG